MKKIKKNKNEFFNGIKNSLQEAIKMIKNNEVFVTHIVVLNKKGKVIKRETKKEKWKDTK